MKTKVWKVFLLLFFLSTNGWGQESAENTTQSELSNSNASREARELYARLLTFQREKNVIRTEGGHRGVSTK